MINEKWEVWEPVQAVGDDYAILDVRDTNNGFILDLLNRSDNKKSLRIRYSAVWAYRSTYESFRQKTTHEVCQKYGSDFFAGKTFFKIKDSMYLKWLSEESYEITDDLSITHFVFFDSEEIVDVISGSEPEFTVLELSDHE